MFAGGFEASALNLDIVFAGLDAVEDGRGTFAGGGPEVQGRNSRMQANQGLRFKRHTTGIADGDGNSESFGLDGGPNRNRSGALRGSMGARNRQQKSGGGDESECGMSQPAPLNAVA